MSEKLKPLKRNSQWYGWTPDIPDHRDRIYSAVSAPTKLPAKVDLRASFPPCYDQGSLGSCTANAIAGALEYLKITQNQPLFRPSRLFIYFNERAMEGTITVDAGAMIRDGIKSVAKLGAPPEDAWRYTISKFKEKPSSKAYELALLNQAIEYRRVCQSLTQLRTCLSQGFPFVFGFSVFSSFEGPDVAKTGNVPLPPQNEAMLGGHAVLAVGYDDEKKVFIVRNSWGTRWGQKGYFMLPYDYLTNPNLSDDFWTISKSE